MSAMASTRRLTTILAADVSGYSRLMGDDEEGTHERLKAHFQQLIDPKIKEHQGRIFKNTGDGALVEFASVVDAVRCAAEVQREMIDRDAEMPEERRIKFRIGVNLGDVIAEGEDIFGDGVNVAARLEALADPGGICISRAVREQIRDRLKLPFEDGGEQNVKNIARPVRVYTLSAKAVAALPKTEALAAPEPVRRLYQQRHIGAVALAGFLIIAGCLWWLWPSPRAPSVAPASEKSAWPTLPSAVPRLSIVVLPFKNLSNDPGQQYFADGVTESLTTDLSRIAGVFVISRNTAYTYQEKPINAKQIGRELGVRYVLEGSVQRTTKQIRANAQLIDAQTDAHLWAERFDLDIVDLFTLQNEITSRIANALNRALIGAEAAHQSANPDAVDYIFQARAVGSKPPTPDNLAEMIGLFERALALDPGSAEAKTRLALEFTSRVLLQMSSNRDADLARAQDLLAQVSPDTPLAHWAKGQLLRAQRRYTDAIPEYEAAIALDPNLPSAYGNLAQTKLLTGSFEEVNPLVEQAIRLSPRDPQLGYWYDLIGLTHLLQSRTDEAIVWLEKARSAIPTRPFIHADLAAAYGLKGDSKRAAAELAEARRLSVNSDTYSSIAKEGRFRVDSLAPKVRDLFQAIYEAGWRKAGMPEE
jgi:TolB-like protein/class 3 adenylate cyclase/Flp pilus assembly protein TadD